MRILFLAALFIASNLSAQNQIPDYLGAPFPTEMMASSDGQTIAWVFNDKGSRNIYSASTPFNQTKQLTAYSGDIGVEISDLVFSPDGRTIYFVRGNGPNSQGESANPAQLQQSTDRTIWRVNTDGSGMKEIRRGVSPSLSPDGHLLIYRVGSQVWSTALNDSLNPQQLFIARGFPFQFRWSPDGKTLAFVSGRGDHSFIGLYSLTEKTVVYPDPGLDQQWQPTWSPDGKQLAYLNVPNVHQHLLFTPLRSGNPWSIRVLDLSSGRAKEAWKADPGKGSIFLDDIPTSDNYLWWPSANQLILPWEKDGWQHLYSLDMTNGKARLLTPGDGEIENVAVSQDGQSLYYTTNISDINRRHIWKMSLPAGTIQQLTRNDGIEWSPVITASGIALIHSSATKPAWPAILENGEIKDIAPQLFPKEFPSALVKPQAVTIIAKDGMKCTADLFLPAGYDPLKKYPSVIFFHGGSRRQMLLGFHYSQYYSNAYALNQYFAANGYIALSVNYRSGIGYGLDFREALNYGASGASEVNDVIAAGEYLKSRKDIDARKIGLWGGSYGGFLTAHGLARASNLFACGVDIHGVHNWNDEIPIFIDWYDYAKFPDMAAKALQSSPISYVKGWKSPVLLIHGDDDRNVYFSESVNIAEKLTQQGVHVEQLVFPDEIHGFLLQRNWIKAYEAAFDFVQRQFGRN